ncbi:tetratricopeptide repeat protein [Dictyobacter arantiisoli]|uniref:Uncharacterized protein n=1 Tax=Dictyobacter arantiisoli TaxID=2014874 RepID=A0A5A5T857_9CHLR|nr:tetratricopeptide repeat protein [Dictyobacter arantiisoli]GCF07660.1 hypothetical protein KDI_12240 [Dictyobacter arantiisoli]
MSSKKDITIELSPEETIQTEELFSHYPEIAQQLHKSEDQAQIETALAAITTLSESAQVALLKALAKTNRSDAADILVAVNAVHPLKEVRKEARRGLLRLEGSKTFPHWKAPGTQAPAVQLATANPPRFWKGIATQSREEGEVQVTLAWEQGFDYNEVRIIGFLLDFWEVGVKEAFSSILTKRKAGEELHEMAAHNLGGDIETTPCSLAEAKRLLEEALSVHEWHHTKLNEDYRALLPLINTFILQVDDPGVDNGQRFIAHDMAEQEVAVNFIGGWSFGDYGLANDLLAEASPVRADLSRDEWIQLHRAWFDEAHPARLELGFVRELKPVQSTLWVPDSVTKSRPITKKELEIGWSLELLETPLSGTLHEMPMGTAINKTTGRHWFWTNCTLVQEQNSWRIQQLKDEGAALQGLSVQELQKRVKDYEFALEEGIQQHAQDPENFIEEISWRLGELLHFDDALLVHLAQDREAYDHAYDHSVLTGNSERTMVYLERLVQRFPDAAAENLRRLGATMAELAHKFEGASFIERRQKLLQRAEETLREACRVNDSALSHTLLGELLVSIEQNVEAQQEFLNARELSIGQPNDPAIEDSIEAGLANIAMREEHFEDALAHFKRVSELNPAYPGVWFSLGFTHRLLGRLEEAETYYERALQTESSDIRIYSELTALYAQRGEITRAQTLLQDAIRRYPDAAYLHALFASVLEEKGDHRQAVKQLEEAESLEPDSDFIMAVRQQIFAGGRKRV